MPPSKLLHVSHQPTSLHGMLNLSLSSSAITSLAMLMALIPAHPYRCQLMQLPLQLITFGSVSENAKETLTPRSATAKLTIQDNSECVDSIEYHKIIGALQYLGLTRPDIAFVVNRLSQFMQKPTTNH